MLEIQGTLSLMRDCLAGASHQDVFALLRRIEAYDPWLRQHGERTAGYAVALASKIGLGEVEIVDLYRAGLLHDIGRLTLPAEILNKDGALSIEEYALVQSHPRAGAELLESYSFLHVPAVLIAHHHERWDGYGYPYGLRASFIPLGSRILAVADTFDALTTEPTHGTPHDCDSALRLLQAIAGSQLDPVLVEEFIPLAPAAFDSICSAAAPTR